MLVYTMSEKEKQILVQQLSEKLTPEEKEKVKEIKRPYTPPQLRGFKLRYNVGELVVNTDVKIKAIKVPDQTDIFEINKATGNKVRSRPIDKSTGKRLINGFGYNSFDEITNEPVPDNQIQLVQLKPDPESPTQFKQIEVAKFSKTDEVDITDVEILPRQVLNEWIVDKEYEIYGKGADLYKVAKSLVEKNAMAGIKEFVLIEGKTMYKAFLVPPSVLMENKFYMVLKLARRKRESLIKSWLNANDIEEVKEKKIKQGAKIEASLDEW